MFVYLAAKTFWQSKKTVAHTGDEPTSIFWETTGSYGGGLSVTTSDGSNCLKTTMAAHHEINIAAIASVISEIESLFR